MSLDIPSFTEKAMRDKTYDKSYIYREYCSNGYFDDMRFIFEENGNLGILAQELKNRPAKI